MTQLWPVKGTGKSSRGHLGKVFSLKKKVTHGESAGFCHMLTLEQPVTQGLRTKPSQKECKKTKRKVTWVLDDVFSQWINQSWSSSISYF